MTNRKQVQKRGAPNKANEEVKQAADQQNAGGAAGNTEQGNAPPVAAAPNTQAENPGAGQEQQQPKPGDPDYVPGPGSETKPDPVNVEAAKQALPGSLDEGDAQRTAEFNAVLKESYDKIVAMQGRAPNAIHKVEELKASLQKMGASPEDLEDVTVNIPRAFRIRLPNGVKYALLPGIQSLPRYVAQQQYCKDNGVVEVSAPPRTSSKPVVIPPETFVQAAMSIKSGTNTFDYCLKSIANFFRHDSEQQRQVIAEKLQAELDK